MNVAIIPCRAGSKGIPGKNIYPLAGKPLVVWSVEQARKAACISKVYVSTDGDDIAAAACAAGAEIIVRPAELASDTASSESAILHALIEIERTQGAVENVVFLQATSPLREPFDIDNAMALFSQMNADSLFSCSRGEVCYLWEEEGGFYKSVSYDYKNRQPRQQMKPQYLENGSIYIFKSGIFKKEKNRLSGKIVAYEMPLWKSVQIDNDEELKMCEAYLRDRILTSKY